MAHRLSHVTVAPASRAASDSLAPLPKSRNTPPMASSELNAPADVAAPPAEATTTSSGLAYKVLEKGTGTQHPSETSVVEVHYTGWTTDGKIFDSSIARGRSATFPLDGVIAGWTEGLQLMVEGEKARFWIPAGLAYGDQPRGGAPAGTLVFDVQLLAIKR